MTIDQIKKMMDACYLAKRVRELMPKLPSGSNAFVYPVSGRDSETGAAKRPGEGVRYQRCPGTSKTWRDQDGERDGVQGIFKKDHFSRGRSDHLHHYYRRWKTSVGQIRPEIL